MVGLSTKFDPVAIGASTRALWTRRGLPRGPGAIGPPGGDRTRQVLGAFGALESPLDRLVRGVTSDAIGRYLAMTGRRVVGLVGEAGPIPPETLVAARTELSSVAAWTSEAVPVRSDTPEGLAHVQPMIDTLAKAGIVAAREFPFRFCPTCETPRTPETIVYQSERGPAYLVRFPVRDAGQPTSLVVWTDSPWKLLGTTSILVSPDLPYVTAVYRRRGVVERVILAESAIARLQQWLPGCEIEVLDRRPGRDLAGTAYLHPLLTECPPVADFPPPAGTVLASPEVGDSGTGVVGLVPRHGAADSQAAAALHVDGPVVVTPKGIVQPEPRHKYSGLPIEAADAFVLRDLTESGLVFAELTVQRGVPHCTICGSGLIWLPGRAWSLEAARIPAPVEREFSRLLPEDSLPPHRDVVPWPLTGTLESESATDPALLECDACERLHPTSHTGACPCGAATLLPVRRKLLPAFALALGAWAEVGPGEAVELFVPDRRRVPSVVHHLVAREASGVRPGELRLIRLPTIPDDASVLTPSSDLGADAIRAGLIRATNPDHRPTYLSDRLRQESRRLRKLWQLARTVLTTMAEDGVVFDLDYPVSHLTELPDEDRAFLSRFERVRNEVRGYYESLDLDAALDRLTRFLEQDVSTGYLPLARTRLNPDALPSVRGATCQVLARVLYLWVQLFAPVAPFTSEAIAQGFLIDSPSLFEQVLTPVADALIDSAREKEFDRWVDFSEALRSARHQVGLPMDAILPRVVLLVADDELAAELERVAPVLARVGRTGQIEIDAPSRAWAGRRIEARPVPAEIQRVYGSRTGRILHLLERIPDRRAMEGMRHGTLSVVLDGQTVKILPGMIEFLESLPECVIPVPWRDGEILLVDPTENVAGSLPSLSLDGLAVVRHVARRIRRGGERPAPERVLAAASGALAGELEHHAAAIAEHLHVGRFQLVGDDVRFPFSERSTGRTRRGDRWAIWIPGLAVPSRRTKHPKQRPRGARVRRAPPQEDGFEDASIEGDRRRYEAIVAISDQLTADVGRPIAGPSKVSAAWERGFRSIEDYRSTPFEALEAVPGFGHFVAAEIVGRYGGTVPLRVPRYTPRAPAPDPEAERPDVLTPPALAPAPTNPSEPELEREPPSIVVPSAVGADAGREVGSPTAEGSDRVRSESRSQSGPTRTSPRIQAPKLQLITPARRVSPPVLTPIGDGSPSPPSAPIPSEVPRGVPRPEPLTVAPLPALPREPPAPSPFAPRPEPVGAEPPPRPSGVEVWRGLDSEGAWSTFLEETQGGERGLCITREPPGARRSALGRRAVQVVWLSNIPLGPANPTARPGDLDGLEAGIRSEIVDHGTKAVFLESLEYLVTIHGAARVAQFLASIDEIGREHDARILVPLRSGLLDPAAVQTIAGTFRGPPISPSSDSAPPSGPSL